MRDRRVPALCQVRLHTAIACRADASALSAMQAAAKLKAAVQSQLGLTLSCGLGPSKLLARLVGPLNKPDGLTALPHAAAVEYLNGLPLRQIPSLRCAMVCVLYMA